MILLAEDDEDDQEIIALAFKKASMQHDFRIASNGQEVLDFLSGLSEKELPCLIVLDLNMPVLDGFQTLEALKTDGKYNDIPTIIFTTSDSAEDKRRCIAKGATDYLVKPYNMTDIVSKVEKMLDYCA